MRHKYRLIVPTILTVSIFTSTIVVSADEFESKEQKNIVEEGLSETPSMDKEHMEKTEIETNPNQISDDGSNDIASRKESQVKSYNELLGNSELSKDQNTQEDINDIEIHDEVSKGNESVEAISSEVDATEKGALEDSKPLEDQNTEDFINDIDLHDKASEENESEEFISTEADKTEDEELESSETSENQNTEDDINDIEIYDEVSEENESVEAISSEADKTEDEELESFETSENQNTEDDINDIEIFDEVSEESESEEFISTVADKTEDEEKYSKKDVKNSDSEDGLFDKQHKSITLMSSSSLLKDTSIPMYSDAQLATKIRSQNNSGLYSPITSDKSVSAQRFSNTTLFINRKAQYNGTTYYRILRGLDGPMQGWMKAEDLNLFHHTTPANHNKKYYIDPNNNHRYLLDEPWGSSNQRVRQLNQFDSNAVFNAEKSMQLGALTYYYGKIDDNYGWVQDNHLQNNAPLIFSSAKYSTKIKSSNNSGLYSPITSNNSKSAQRFLNTTLFVDRQADYNGTTYYRILRGLDGPMQGWMKSQDLNLFTHTTPTNHNRKYYINSNNRDQYLLDEPWGTSKQRIEQLNKYNSNSVFNAEKIMNLGVLTFYYGKIENDYGWVQDRYLQNNAPLIFSSAKYSTKIKSSNNSGLYSPITSNNSKSAQRFLNTTLFVDRQANYNGTTYYRILRGLDGPMQGWMKSQDLNLFTHTTPANHNRKYYINSNNRDQYLLDEPWGTSKQRVKQLNKYNSNSVFNAEKTMNLGVLTFYYGKIGNDYGWIQDRYLTTNLPSPPSNEVEENTVRYNQSLNSVLNTQMNLNAKPQAWVNGGGWRNATRNEVRNFLDTSHQQGGAWDYTFLNLNQNQGISSSVLNQKILSNRGILTNRGNAFTQASKRHGVNEVYLISHAVLETGHGSSQLAQGIRLNSAGNISSNGKKYYNMYGIGAVDNNALLGGARYAQRMGWDTPEKAIIGGAAFVSQNYFNRGQTTLYSMRWNPRNPGTYQYATDVNWAYATASNLKSYYDALGIRGRYFTRHIF